jgi:hypothetical protein
MIRILATAAAANGMLAAIAAVARMRIIVRPEVRQLTVSSAGRQACAHNSFTLFADPPLTLKP